MKTQNQLKLNSMFGLKACTGKDIRDSLVIKDRYYAYVEEEKDKELIAKCSPADFSGVTNEDR